MFRRALVIFGCFVLAACSAVPVTPTPTRKRTIEYAALPAAIAKADGATYRLTYSVNGTAEGVHFAGRWIVYQSPPRKRVDIAIGGGGGISKYYTLYFSGTDVVACALPYRPGCQVLDPSDLPQVDGGLFPDELFRTPRPDMALAEIVEETIAGVPVSCFTLRGRETSGAAAAPSDAGKLAGASHEAVGCFTADGIAMRLAFRTTGHDYELNGTSLYHEVAEADLKLPADALP